ncbi:MAG TPA: SpoIIE family protein phosphatase [Candidatus Elarobacter sp.]
MDLVDGAGVDLRSLVDHAPAIVFVARADGTIAFANAAWTRFSGISVDAVLEHGWADVLHADDASWVIDAWLRAMTSATVFREQFRVRDRDGEYRWVISHAVPSFDGDGEVLRWYGSLTPVDDQARAAQRRAILDRLGVAFAESLEFERTAHTVVSAMCEDFADFAFVDVFNAEGCLERSAVDSGRLAAPAESFKTFAPPSTARNHPINIVLLSGKPQIVSVCDDDWLRTTTWSDAHYAFARSLPIASIAYVPMIAAGERVGVLTFGAATGTGRSFSQSDLDDAQEIARRAAVALANARLYRDLAASEARYRGLIDTAQEGVWILDADQRTRYVNARFTEILGYGPDEMYGRRVFDFVEPSDVPDVLRALAQQAAGTGYRGESRLVRKDGQIAWVTVASSPLFDAAGGYAGALGMFTDITARKASETRYRVLARASEMLSGSLDLDRLLGRFAELLVEELAAEATIAIHPDRAVVRQRGPVDDTLPLLRIPLRHRDVELGSVTLRGSAPARRIPFGPEDVALLEELAARASVAIENAQLYERKHRVAMTLQRAMLPALLPEVGGLAFDAVYRPGATEAEVGGDWYDAIALPDGRVILSIGDVTGRGLTAAVIMGRMRQAIEALATYEPDPVRLLDAADRVLRRAEPNAIVTALVGVLDPVERTLTYATAGHPTPIVRAADGTIRQLPGRGLPLGLRDGRQPPASSVVLPASALIVLFTDGLVESTRDIGEGERRVYAALRDPAVACGRAPAAALVANVLDDGVRDDVAVLTVRVGDEPAGAPGWTMRWHFDPHDGRAARDVRETLAEMLGTFVADIDLHAAQLVFGELVGNALRHAPGDVDVEVSWDDPATPVLHVFDRGAGYSAHTDLPSHEAESGRGLYIVSQLTRGFTVTPAGERGAHARAVLLKRR